jgi:hypothetical protein
VVYFDDDFGQHYSVIDIDSLLAPVYNFELEYVEDKHTVDVIRFDDDLHQQQRYCLGH